MAAMMCGCIANIILDPLMIFGIGQFPAMGIEGAALATGIGQTLTLAIYLFICFMRPLGLNIKGCYLKPDSKMILRLYSVGIPATLNLALPSILISALNGILAAYSEVYILVLGIYYKLQTFLYLPANGIVQGMRPLIGYNYGAGEHDRVKQIYRLVLIMCAMIMMLGTVICLLVPDLLMSLFTGTQETIEAGAAALRVISAGFIVSAVSVASSGALEGLGKGEHLPYNLLVPLHCGHPACGICPQQAFWTVRRMAQFLGDRGCNRCDLIGSLPKRRSHEPR